MHAVMCEPLLPFEILSPPFVVHGQDAVLGPPRDDHIRCQQLGVDPDGADSDGA